MEIIDGHGGKAHVTAAQVGLCNIGEYGKDGCILNVGNCLKGQIIGGNKFRVLDGCFSIQGRRGYIAPGTYEEVTIENGGQGRTRKDAVVIEFNRHPASAVESFTLKVVQGGYSEIGTLPQLTQSDINKTGTIHQEALYILSVTDAGIQKAVPVMPVLDSAVSAIAEDPDTSAVGGVGFGFLQRFGRKIYAWTHAKAVLYSTKQTVADKIVAMENDYNGKISNVAQEAIQAFQESMLPVPLSVTTDPNTFNVVGNSSYHTGQIASIHLYIKSASDVMNVKEEVLVGAIGIPVKKETNICLLDDVSKQVLTGKIKVGGAITVFANNLPGERYLIIDTTICFGGE